MSEIIPIADQIACLERELHIRERIYPRWVDKGKLTQKAAALELERMRAAVRTLQRSMTDGTNPGEIVTGELFGPAKARAVERAKILGVLADLLDAHAMYRVVQQLQALDGGLTEKRQQ
jgi:hypothetical protein